MQRTTSHEALKAREAHLQQLLLLGLDGDEAAYRQFLTLLSAHLRSFLRRRLQSPEVEDLLQEALLAVHNARHTYRSEQPVTAWVQAIARYKLMDHFRAHARHDALNDPLSDQEELLADEDHQAQQAQRDLARLLDLIAEIVFFATAGCMTAQVDAEIRYREGGAASPGNYQGYNPVAQTAKPPPYAGTPLLTEAMDR